MRLTRSFLLSIILSACSKFSSAQDGWIAGSPKLAYWSVGDSSKPLLIMLHGGPGVSHNYLQPEWDQLSDVARIIYYDQRGCGKSEKAACYSWRDNMQDLKRTIQTLAGGRQVILAGSSWGTILAIMYAHTYPADVRAMILSGTVAWSGKGDRPLSCEDNRAQVLEKYPALKNDPFSYLSLKLGYSISPYAGDSLSPERIKEHKLLEIRGLLLRLTLNSLQDAPTLKQLGKINLPTLIFQATGVCKQARLNDGTLQFIGILPQLKIVKMPDTCHDPWYTQPIPFFEAARYFIQRLD